MIMFKNALKAKLSRSASQKVAPGNVLEKRMSANEGPYRESERGYNPPR
jgi:hypothetical protein